MQLQDADLTRVLHERDVFRIRAELVESALNEAKMLGEATVMQLFALEEKRRLIGDVQVAVRDERMGELGKAYVVLREGERATPDAVIAWCREKMANYKVPRFVDIVAVLPTIATVKVQKFRLKTA